MKNIKIYFATAILTAYITPLQASTLTIPNTFSAGSPAVAAEVNDNFSSAQTAVNDNDARITSNSQQILNGNSIPNGSFSNGLSGWETNATNSTGTLELATDGSAPAGDTVVQNSTNGVVWASSQSWIQINQDRTYRVMGTFKRTAAGSVGTAFLAVRLRDATGTEISGDGEWWFYAAQNVTPTADVWTSYSGEFGAGTSNPFPANAREATVAFIINYDTGNVGGTRVYQAQGLGIFSAQSPIAWKNMVLSGTTTVYGQGFQVPQYRKMGDEVCLRGLLDTIPTDNSPMATLPSGYTPAATLIFSTAVAPGGGDLLYIANTGTLTAQNNTSSLWKSLDGVCFSTTP